LLRITSATIQKFFWQNIVCRFGVPHEVTVDNGKQFDSTDFKEFCTYLGTKLCFASVYHPQSNGAVERANGVIFAGIKRNITDLPKSKWAEEVPAQVPPKEPAQRYLTLVFLTKSRLQKEALRLFTMSSPVRFRPQLLR
jgi:transposase InsO family protein